MARNRKTRTSAARPATTRGGSVKEKIIDSCLALLAEKSYEQIGLAEIADRAKVSLADLREEFGSTLAILADHIKNIDQAVLAGIDVQDPTRRTTEAIQLRVVDPRSLVSKLQALYPGSRIATGPNHTLIIEAVPVTSFAKSI